jgi:membrane protease YdiL (CAAX protease family)
VSASLLAAWAFALCALPLVLLAARRAGADTLGLAVRALLWVATGIAVAWVVAELDDWSIVLGLRGPSLTALAYAMLATLLVLGAWPALQWLQRRSMGQSSEAAEAFQSIIALPTRHRVFIVVTAGVTEELAYRGIGIGMGALLFGNTGIAVALSLIVFVISHLRWGAAHLVSVAWAGLVLSLLFVATRDLYACILLMPMVMRSRQTAPGRGA